MRASKAFSKMSVCILLAAVWSYGGAAYDARAQTDPQDEQKARKADRPVNVLRGRVLDKDNKPLANVIVAVADARQGYISWNGKREVYVIAPDAKVLLFITKHNGRRGDQAETDSEGCFVMRGLAHGRYNLVAIDPDKGLTRVENVKFSEDSKPLEVVLEPFAESPKLALKGRVVDEEGEPVADVSVAVAGAASGYIFCDASNHLQATCYSYEESTSLVVEDGEEAGLRGPWFLTPTQEGRQGTANSDAEGAFTIPNLEAGQYHFAALHPKKGQTLMAEVALTEDAKPIRAVLTPPATKKTLTFRARVLDYEGDPVADATVAIADSAKGRISKFGTDGLFAYCASPQQEEFSWFSVQQDPPRAGQATTGDRGSCSIHNIEPGSYNVVASHKDKGVAIMKDVTFEKGGGPVEIALDKPAYVKGRIKGLKAARRSFYSLAPKDMPEHVDIQYPITLGEGGRFRVGPLFKADNWALSLAEYVEQQGYAATVLTAPVRVRTGRTTRLTVDLTEGSTFAGEVRGPKDEALSGVSVLASAADDSGWAYGAVTDADGKYAIKGLPDGDFKLEMKRHAKRTAPG
jgi:protocatechuate 3,4-dioxygenase beta subunit